MQVLTYVRPRVLAHQSSVLYLACTQAGHDAESAVVMDAMFSSTVGFLLWFNLETACLQRVSSLPHHWLAATKAFVARSDVAAKLTDAVMLDGLSQR